MVQGGGSNSERDADAADFATALSSLKHRGSSLLVVGGVPDETYGRASTQMLGDPSAAPPRRRVLVVPASEVVRAKRRLEGTGPLDSEWARIVTYETEARGTAAQGSDDLMTEGPASSLSPTTEVTGPEVEHVSGTVADLGTTIAEVIDELAEAADGFEPAELRLGFDLLPALLVEYERDTVFRFCHVLTNQIRKANGMGHFWLPQTREDDTVRTFDTLFDATIELRIDGHLLEQRWHFRDALLVSDWLPVDA